MTLHLTYSKKLIESFIQMHINTKCHQTLDGFLAELWLYHKVSVEQLDLVAESY